MDLIHLEDTVLISHGLGAFVSHCFSHENITTYIFHLNCLSQTASRLRRHMMTQYETLYVSVIGHVKVKVSSMAMKLTPQLFNTLLTNFSQP